MILPYRAEVVVARPPIANMLIIVSCVAFFFMMAGGYIPDGILMPMILDGWNPIGMVGHLFVHSGLTHLFFNMVFLWVFGNAVCETMGNWRYLVAYLVMGVVAGAAHNIFDGNPAIGASGAINGVVGFYLIMYPVNKVDCLYWIFFRIGVCSITGYWLVILWFLGDAWGAFAEGESTVAYWAHLGGLFSGVLLGVLFELKGWARLAHYDNPSLIDLLFRKSKEPTMLRHRDEQGATEPSYHLPDESVSKEDAVELAEMTVETMSQEISLQCPHCERTLVTNLGWNRNVLICPHCDGRIELQYEQA